MIALSFIPHDPNAPHTDADDLLLGVPMAAVIADAEPEEEFVKKKLGWGFWVSIAWLVVIIGLAVLAPVLPIDDPQDPASQFVNDPGRPRTRRRGSVPTSWVATSSRR